MGLTIPTTIPPERDDQPMPYEGFVGIDWGSQQHQVCVLDRDRHSVAGAKDDRRDAFVLADAVRTDRPSFRRLHLDDPQLLILRERSRAEETLLEDFRHSGV